MAGVVVCQLERQGWNRRTKRATLLQGWYMVGRGRHQHNEINAVFRAIRKFEWLTVVESHNGHRWGWIECACGAPAQSIWCTPRNPGNHAKRILRWVDEHAECAKNEEKS
ncbi:hypothetical protein [Nonomuraea sp. B1E8]|uniref:hypothetical protein n=1 Tax=unclassified Nonomuraea TaxID=2593643 RepID=UPI00325EFF43